MIRFIYILFLAFFASLIHAQQLNSYSFNELYNFDIKTVYSIAQDSSGEFWFGTDEGLVNFDGKSFAIYAHEDYNRIASNVKIDKHGKIWFTNFSGQMFYVQKDSVYPVLGQGSNAFYVLEYFFLEDAVYYFTSEKKNIFKLDLATNTVESIFAAKENEMINSLYLKGAKIRFAIVRYDYAKTNHTQRNSLIIYNVSPNTNAIAEHLASVLPFNSKSTYPTFIYNNKDYVSYVFNNEYGIIDLKTNTKLKSTLSKWIDLTTVNEIQKLDNNLFVSTKHGFFKYNLEDLSQQAVWQLKDKSISHLFKDAESNYWIASLDEGLFIVPNTAFTHSRLSESKILSSSLDESNNLYFVDSKGQLNVAYPPYRSSEIIPSKQKLNYKVTYNSYNNCLYFVQQDLRYNIEKGIFETLPFSLYFRNALFLNENTAILSGASNSVFASFDGKKVSLADLSYPLKIKDYKPQNTLKIADNGSQLLAKNADAEYIYIDNKNSVSYYAKNGDAGKLKYEGKDLMLTALYTDEYGDVWATSIKHQLFQIINEKVIYLDSIPEQISKIIRHDSYLFLLAKHGITKYDLVNKQPVIIDETDGLLEEQFVDMFCHKDTLHILGVNNMQQIHVSYQFVNTTPPQFRIKSVKLYDENLPLKKTYHFNYDEDNLRIDFSAISIRSKQKFTYKYRLIGAIEKWQQTDNNAAFARFPKLSSGSYVFELKVCNEDGVCSEVKSLSFRIAKPFYQRWWFYVLLIITTSFVISILAFYRLREERKKAKLKQENESYKKEMLSSQISALRAQMNPHFMFNALNTIQNFIVNNQGEIASEYLADFADLTRLYLNQSKKDYVTLKEEIETLQFYLRLEKLRFDDTLNYFIEVDDEIDESSLTIPVMLIQPFVENSLKHGLMHKPNDRRLKISFLLQGNCLKCVIEDNGIGRKQSAEINLKRKSHQSFATSAIAQRIALYNEQRKDKITTTTIDLTDEYGEASGTKIILEIPL